MATMKKWREGFPSRGIDAEVAAVELERIRMDTGDLSAESIVEAAEPAGSVLHTAFEWDDAVAAGAYRKDQARDLRGALIEHEIIEGDDAPSAEHQVYTYVTIAEDDGTTRRKFGPTTVLLQDEESRAQILARAFREAATFRRRYASVRELAEVHGAIDRTLAVAAE